jgi:quinol monooxygenase YgiN
MLAKLAIGDIDPHRLTDATRAVHEELIPAFLEHPGALEGYWMANALDGHVLVMTTWTDLESLDAARAADGATRARTAERLGLRVHAIQTMDVLGFRGNDHVERPLGRCTRATWVEGVSADLRPSIRAIYQEILPSQVRSPGFCASYWLADPATGNGLALSMWEHADQLRAGEVDSRRRRRHFERTVGCHIDLVTEYEALAVVTPTGAPLDAFPVLAGELVGKAS